MSYEIQYTNQYEKDLKKCIKRGFNIDDLFEVVELLKNGEPLPEKYRDHLLVGNYKGKRELHIKPDWLLIYEKEEAIKLITLLNTGTHADLF